MPRPDDVTSIDALYVVAHADHLHPVYHTALFDTLPWRERRGGQREKTSVTNIIKRQERFKRHMKRGLFEGFSKQRRTNKDQNKREVKHTEVCVCVYVCVY